MLVQDGMLPYKPWDRCEVLEETRAEAPRVLTISNMIGGPVTAQQRGSATYLYRDVSCHLYGVLNNFYCFKSSKKSFTLFHHHKISKGVIGLFEIHITR